MLTCHNNFSSNKSIMLSGAVTGLENRHSMGLQVFLDLLDETPLDIFECLVFILIQGDSHYPLDF